jgi:hypothetical protein
MLARAHDFCGPLTYQEFTAKETAARTDCSLSALLDKQFDSMRFIAQQSGCQPTGLLPYRGLTLQFLTVFLHSFLSVNINIFWLLSVFLKP